MVKPSGMRARRALAAAGLALVLVVVAASAAIRLSGQDLGAWMTLVRGTHRASASIATVLIVSAAFLGWRAGRRSLAAALVALTAGLSVLGAATGIAPPPAAQAANLLGGLALAALLARFCEENASSRKGDWLFALLAFQACLGTWLSIFADELWSWPLLAHAMLGVALATAAVWLATRIDHPGLRLALAVLAVAVPAAGVAAALLAPAFAPSLAHAAAAALFVAALAWGLTHIKGAAARA
jgi:hypothetical protein